MFYPAYINLQNRKCLVIGGGTVAERKVVSMLISGGDVTVVSPDATELVAFLAEIGSIRWHKRDLIQGDTNGYFLVCAATDFITINSAVFTEAHETNNIRLVNVVDVIPQCTFAAASVVTDGEVMLSISTSGKSPATSRRIREHFEEMLNASSLYTLGYENGKPVSVGDLGLPYPVYLLLNNRKCVVLCDHKTPEIQRRITLLRLCDANVICLSPDEVKSQDFENAFLVISTEKTYLENCLENDSQFIYELLDDQNAGTHFTPNLIIDDDLIVSISAKNGNQICQTEDLFVKLKHLFENNGFGAYINLLGTRRSEVLEAFPTSKMRADFFETLIGHVADTSKTCCLSLTDQNCTAECLFNWVRHGKIDQANTLITNLLNEQRAY
ncbi:bifunctional precorrin-2 dehydrogenase/sirohydrochlorin ferrochelatase, partial [Candidatus Poribacteria bacterium]|nr:bifunctional precorrin-2 dehydrogenase/sirohydrochlorin ferrochelatase [Candidatus Poribacteria bacterium]